MAKWCVPLGSQIPSEVIRGGIHLPLSPTFLTATFNPHAHLNSWSQSPRLSDPAAPSGAGNQSNGWEGKQECKATGSDSHMHWVTFCMVIDAVYSGSFSPQKEENHKKDTHTHNKGAGSMQTRPGFVWAAVDRSGNHCFDLDPWPLFVHWTAQPVRQVSINTALRASPSYTQAASGIPTLYTLYSCEIRAHPLLPLSHKNIPVCASDFR